MVLVFAGSVVGCLIQFEIVSRPRVGPQIRRPIGTVVPVFGLGRRTPSGGDADEFCWQSCWCWFNGRSGVPIFAILYEVVGHYFCTKEIYERGMDFPNTTLAEKIGYLFSQLGGARIDTSIDVCRVFPSSGRDGQISNGTGRFPSLPRKDQ